MTSPVLGQEANSPQQESMKHRSNLLGSNEIENEQRASLEPLPELSALPERAESAHFPSQDNRDDEQPLFADTYSNKNRKNILASLWDNPSAEDLKPLDNDTTMLTLRRLANDPNSETVRGVRRFNNVYVETILRLQHEIISIEEQMSQGTIIRATLLPSLLNEYASLVRAYKELSVLPRLSKETANIVARRLAIRLHEPRYFYDIDAFDSIDLKPEVGRGTSDLLRKVLQQKLPPFFLDRTGRELRNLDGMNTNDQKQYSSGSILDAKQGLGTMRKIIETHKRNHRYVSPGVDNFARVLFALIGGLFLLVPMIALSYITAKSYLVVTTALFILFFAICLGVFSKGSNHELIGATAAYAAVLVVFVGNTIGAESSG